jgi:hypothetical protein
MFLLQAYSQNHNTDTQYLSFTVHQIINSKYFMRDILYITVQDQKGVAYRPFQWEVQYFIVLCYTVIIPINQNKVSIKCIHRVQNLCLTQDQEFFTNVIQVSPSYCVYFMKIIIRIDISCVHKLQSLINTHTVSLYLHAYKCQL